MCCGGVAQLRRIWGFALHSFLERIDLDMGVHRELTAASAAQSSLPQAAAPHIPCRALAPWHRGSLKPYWLQGRCADGHV